jgi:predicted PurR-regulated permease PerM
MISKKQKQNIILIMIVLLGLFLAYSLRIIFSAILGAIILYTLFRNLYIKLVVEKKWRNIFAFIFIAISTFTIIILPFFTLSWMVIDKLSYFNSNPKYIQDLISHLSSISGIDLNHSSILETVIKNIETWALGSFPTLVNALLSVFLLITIMYFLLYFMFKEYLNFEAAIIHYLPFNKENSLTLGTELSKITFSNVLGQGIIAIAQGTLIGIGFYIFNITDPIFWGVVGVLLSFIPIVGSGLVFIPAALIAISYQNYTAGFGILLWGALIVANIDNVIRLIINRKYANTHPIVSIVGVIIGIPVFGVLGLVIGPLLISYFILLIKIYESEQANAINEIEK